MVRNNPIARRLLLGGAAAWSASPLFAQGNDAAAAYPARPLRIVSPYPPGGGTDTTARLIAAPLGALLGQSVVVDNRAGASGSIGAGEVARAPADGHTMLVDALAHLVNPITMRGLPFDYRRDFAPVTQATRLPQIMIAAGSTPAETLRDFIAYARTQKGLSFGSSGTATGQHLAAAMFLRAAGLNDIEHVPYRGGSAALQGLLTGDVAFVMATVNTAAQLVKEKRLRAYAVASETRVPALPEVPTFAEAGFPDVVLDEWNGIFVPSGTSPTVIAKLGGACRQALQDRAVQARLEALGAEPVGSSTEVFTAFLARQGEILGRLIREANITQD